MKAAGIVLAASLFMATQAFAWSEREQSLLLGFGAGILVSHAADIHLERREHTAHTYARSREAVFPRPAHHHKKHACRKRHKRHTVAHIR